MTYGIKLLVLASIGLGGCMVLPSAQAPKTGAVGTGEELAVVDDVKVWVTKHQEKVGEAVHKDENGRKIGSTDVMVEKETVHTQKVWYVVQGPERLSDEDFFRIAGEEKALEETLALRAKGKKWNRNGKITMGVGVVAMIGGYFVPNTLGRTVLSLGGSVAVGTGWYMAYWGAKQMEPESHAVDRSIAERAARGYNQQLGGSSSTGKSGGVMLTKTF